ncbi:hypothetical protein ABPG72_003105 [Tetrahymena utriculariae]
MNQKINLILIVHKALVQLLCQQISLQAKVQLFHQVSSKIVLFFTLKYNQYGFKECQINLIPSISYCSNVITQTAQEAKECGSVDLGFNPQLQGEDYLSNFQIENQQVPLVYNAPNEQSHFYVYYVCFSLSDDKSYSNTLDYLYQKKIDY